MIRSPPRGSGILPHGGRHGRPYHGFLLGHRAMGQEFYHGRFISYGLGNFLFDQMQTINHRRGLIASYHIYNGRHIQTELIPYLLYNNSEPRIVSGKDAKELFDYVYRYSLGPVFH